MMIPPKLAEVRVSGTVAKETTMTALLLHDQMLKSAQWSFCTWISDRLMVLNTSTHAALQEQNWPKPFGVALTCRTSVIPNKKTSDLFDPLQVHKSELA